MTCIGLYISQSTKTIGDLVGTIGEQNYRIGDNTNRSNSPVTLCGDSTGQVYQFSSSTLDNGGVAISKEFQTPDFNMGSTPASILSASLNRANFMRVSQLLLEAKGYSVTAYYSTDSGASWNPCAASAMTLNSSYDIYQFDFDVVCRKIRFKFVNSTVSSSFTFKWFAFKSEKRSPRR